MMHPSESDEDEPHWVMCDGLACEPFEVCHCYCVDCGAQEHPCECPAETSYVAEWENDELSWADLLTRSET